MGKMGGSWDVCPAPPAERNGLPGAGTQLTLRGANVLSGDWRMPTFNPEQG